MSYASEKNDSIGERLKSVDFHSSVASEFRVYTSQGAVLSIVTVIMVIYLIFTEAQYNFATEIRHKVHANATAPTGLDMEFDVTFPNVACSLISIDAQDQMGQPQSLHIDREHRIFKHRLTKEGRQIGRKSKFELGNTLTLENQVEDYVNEKGILFAENEKQDDEEEEEECGDCYGAGDGGECCNTCDDVKRAYHRKGWLFEISPKIRQCRFEQRSSDQMGEGCNVHGIVSLNSGGGNLHLAPSHELENAGKKVMFSSLLDMIEQAFDTFNVSHTIEKVRFGEDYPGVIHQLDGESRMIEDSYGMYQYYVKVVPTLYRYLDGKWPLKLFLELPEHTRVPHTHT